jgi:membrane dipeptidase
MNDTRGWEPFLEEALNFHRNLPVTAPYFEYYGPSSLFLETGGKQCDFSQMMVAGIANFGIALTNGSSGYFVTGAGQLETAGPPEWARERTKANFAAAMDVVRTFESLQIVDTANDLFESPRPGKIAVIPLITGHCYLDSPETLEDFYRLGLRISHCAAISGQWCRAYPTQQVNGKIIPVLTETGKEIIARMNELGVVIDTAHLSDESTEAVLQISTRPLIDGHTGSMDYNPYSRGHRDWVLRRIADGGGVVGIHFADHIFSPKCFGPKYPFPSHRTEPEPPIWAFNRHLLKTVSDPEERMRLRKNQEFQERFYRDHGLTRVAETAADRIDRTFRCSVSDMADHLEYLTKIMGHDHVGLGGDVNGITMDQWPGDMENVGQLPHLTAELIGRGWTEENIEKLLCRNWLRVFREALSR